MWADQLKPVPGRATAIAEPWALVFLEGLSNNVLYYEQINFILIKI